MGTPQRLANTTARPPREAAPGRWEQNQQASGQVAGTDGPAALHGGGGGPRRPARAGAPLWPTRLLPCSGRCVAWAGLFRLPRPVREHAAFAVCPPPIPILPGLLRSRACPTVQVLPQPPVCVLHTSPLLAPRG